MRSKSKRVDVNRNVKEKIENFLYSDSVSATATKLLLMTLATGTIVCGGAIVVGVLKVLKDIKLPSGETSYSKKQVENTLGRLKREKFIKVIKDKKGKTIVKLTNKGKKRVLKFSLDTISIEKPKKWDKKWRIVIFDIPVKMNSAREALRIKIKNLGFYQLQRSVWIYPYNCEDEILFIAEVFGVEEYVEIITAEKLLHENDLSKKFKELIKY